MKYSTGRKFRQALEDRIRNIHQDRNIPLVRIRKEIAFERFLARLLTCQPGTWILKGGLAIQLHMGKLARTTKDIDLLKARNIHQILEPMREAAAVDLGDWFTFEVEQPADLSKDIHEGQRYHVNCFLDGRLFEPFHVDVGAGDVIFGEVDLLSFEPILAFADIRPVRIACYPVIQQIAEKFHALTRIYTSGESSRAKDFVDLLLLAQASSIRGDILQEAIKTTFNNRSTHRVPEKTPTLASSVQREVVRLFQEYDMKYSRLQEAEKALEGFLNPVLSKEKPGNWNPAKWVWEFNTR